MKILPQGIPQPLLYLESSVNNIHVYIACWEYNIYMIYNKEKPNILCWGFSEVHKAGNSRLYLQTYYVVDTAFIH